MARQNAKKLHLHKMSILNKNIEDYFAVSSSAPPRPPLEAKTGAVSSAKQEGQPSHRAAESQEQNDFAGSGGSQRSLRAADQDKLTPLKRAPLSSQVLRGGGGSQRSLLQEMENAGALSQATKKSSTTKRSGSHKKRKTPYKTKIKHQTLDHFFTTSSSKKAASQEAAVGLSDQERPSLSTMLVPRPRSVFASSSSSGKELMSRPKQK